MNDVIQSTHSRADEAREKVLVGHALGARPRCTCLLCRALETPERPVESRAKRGLKRAASRVLALMA